MDLIGKTLNQHRIVAQLGRGGRSEVCPRGGHKARPEGRGEDAADPRYRGFRPPGSLRARGPRDRGAHCRDRLHDRRNRRMPCGCCRGTD